MNTLENNKLIAEFMGAVGAPMYNPTIWDIYITGCLDVDSDLENAKHFYTPDEMEYHSSWEWLMPVVEEMHTYGCEVVISSNGVTTIYAPSGEVLAEESSEEDDHMRDATYKAIVKVLKENLHKPCE